MSFFIRHKFLTIGILVLTIIPFFWFEIGEMDLGGDSSRLYYYDPVNFLQNFGLYGVVPFATSSVDPLYYFIPFLLFHILLKKILISGYLVVLFFNVVKISIGFLGMYLIINEFLKNTSQKKIYQEIAAVIGGLFYIFSPGVISNWNTALITHNQVFLSPLIFFLLLKYLTTSNSLYILFVLLTTFLFAPSFSPGSAPTFFSFYPLSVLFLLLYVAKIKKFKIPWKGFILGIVFFVGIHSFHLLPVVYDFFSAESVNTNRIFTGQSDVERTQYFYGTLGFGRPGQNLLVSLSDKSLSIFGIIFPFVITLGLILAKERKKMLLTTLFFLVTFFLATANISYLLVTLYSKFYYIPGFSMFRNFSGQWAFVFWFYYALLFGQALILVFERISNNFYKQIFAAFTIFAIVIGALHFVQGKTVREFGIDTKDLRIGVRPTTDYESSLSYIRTLKHDSRFLSLPLTSCCFQIVKGSTDGTYIGPSMISYLTGKPDFAGYTNLAPFSDSFLEFSISGNYDKINHILSLLNIRYIYLNKDPQIYRDSFPNYLYTHVDQFLPIDKYGYENFIEKLSSEKISQNGYYSFYEVKKDKYLPRFYIPKEIHIYDDEKSATIYSKSKVFLNTNASLEDVRIMYLSRESCSKVLDTSTCSKDKIIFHNTPEIEFQKINPTKYKIRFKDIKEPFFLVFSNASNSYWKMFPGHGSIENEGMLDSYFNNEIIEKDHRNAFFDSELLSTIYSKPLLDDSHLTVNGFANGWYIRPISFDNKKTYEVTLEMIGQKVFYIGTFISIICIILCVVWAIATLKSKQK